MSEAARDTDDLPCVDVVELVTDYLEGALPPDVRRRFEAHLEECPHCAVYLEQVRQTVRAVGSLSEAAIPGPLRAALVSRFRGGGTA